MGKGISGEQKAGQGEGYLASFRPQCRDLAARSWARRLGKSSWWENPLGRAEEPPAAEPRLWEERRQRQAGSFQAPLTSCPGGQDDCGANGNSPPALGSDGWMGSPGDGHHAQGLSRDNEPISVSPTERDLVMGTQ